MGKIATVLCVMLGIAVAAVAKMPYKHESVKSIWDRPDGQRSTPVDYVPAAYVPTSVPAASDPYADWWDAPIDHKASSCDCGCEQGGVCTCESCPNWLQHYTKAYKAGAPMLVCVRSRHCVPCDRLAIELKKLRLNGCSIVTLPEEAASQHNVYSFPSLILYNAPHSWRHTGYVDAARLQHVMDVALKQPSALPQQFSSPTFGSPYTGGIQGSGRSAGQTFRSCSH